MGIMKKLHQELAEAGISKRKKNSRRFNSTIARRLGLEDEMHFGVYKGYTVEWVINNHYRYLEWAIDKKLILLSDEAQELLNEQA